MSRETIADARYSCLQWLRERASYAGRAIAPTSASRRPIGSAPAKVGPRPLPKSKRAQAPPEGALAPYVKTARPPLATV
jgi:hypothetical protein